MRDIENQLSDIQSQINRNIPPDNTQFHKPKQTGQCIILATFLILPSFKNTTNINMSPRVFFHPYFRRLLFSLFYAFCFYNNRMRISGSWPIFNHYSKQKFFHLKHPIIINFISRANLFFIKPKKLATVIQISFFTHTIALQLINMN